MQQSSLCLQVDMKTYLYIFLAVNLSLVSNFSNHGQFNCDFSMSNNYHNLKQME